MVLVRLGYCAPRDPFVAFAPRKRRNDAVQNPCQNQAGQKLIDSVAPSASFAIFGHLLEGAGAETRRGLAART